MPMKKKNPLNIVSHQINNKSSNWLLGHKNEKIQSDLKVFTNDLRNQERFGISGPENNAKNSSSNLPDTLSIFPEIKNHDTYGMVKKTKRNVFQQNLIDEKYNSPIEYKSIGNPYLLQPIKLQMWLQVSRQNFGPRSNPQCVRWNSHMNFWTRLGCQTEVPSYEILSSNQTILITCTCNQISSYAVLIDVTDPKDIAEPSLPIRIISYSAYLLSLTMLLSVILSLGLLRGLQTNSNAIHQNLVFCIFMAEFLFFFGTNARHILVDNEIH